MLTFCCRTGNMERLGELFIKMVSLCDLSFVFTDFI